MVESSVTTSSSAPSPFASFDEDNNSLSSLDMQIAQTRAQLTALREEGDRQRQEHARQYQTLQSQYDNLQQTLSKSCTRLNLFAYTHAMLQAQTAVVAPYILKKQALLCHAFHHNEVLTKQIHLRQQHCDALTYVLDHSKCQIVDFWQARLTQLSNSIVETKQDMRKQYNELLSLSLLLPSTAAWQRRTAAITQVCVIEEEDEEEDDDVSFASSTSSQSTKEASPPHQHQDVLLHVLSMALAAVSDGGRFFDPPKKSPASSATCSSTTSRTTTTTPSKQLDNIWEDNEPLLRSSLVGFESN